MNAPTAASQDSQCSRFHQGFFNEIAAVLDTERALPAQQIEKVALTILRKLGTTTGEELKGVSLAVNTIVGNFVGYCGNTRALTVGYALNVRALLSTFETPSLAEKLSNEASLTLGMTQLKALQEIARGFHGRMPAACNRTSAYANQVATVMRAWIDAGFSPNLGAVYSPQKPAMVPGTGAPSLSSGSSFSRKPGLTPPNLDSLIVVRPARA